ncbi:MAG TPA: class I SAM-dependent methyltransferase, partial [Puia sp.]|nr:class I SAM-dependent methyltransferase [Puia sp.]
MANNYDPIAAVYDRIHHLFYGQSEVNAQVELLDHVRAGDRLLIVGGGTGWILEKIAGIYPEGLTIVYVESSQKMMERSKKRDWGGNKVEFFTGPVEDWPGSTKDWPESPKELTGGPKDLTGGPVFDCILT